MNSYKVTENTKNKIQDLISQKPPGHGPSFTYGGGDRFFIWILVTSSSDTAGTYYGTPQAYNNVSEEWFTFTDAGAVTVLEPNGGKLRVGKRYLAIKHGNGLFVAIVMPLDCYEIVEDVNLDSCDVTTKWTRLPFPFKDNEEECETETEEG